MIFEQSQTNLVASLSRQAGWNVRFIPDPSKRYKFSKGGYYQVTQPLALADFGSLTEGEDWGELLVIDAEKTEANNIINLIYSADVVFKGFPNRCGNPLGYEIPNDRSEQDGVFKNVFQTNGFFEQFSFDDERPMGVAIAVSAWSTKRTVYAIHKLSQSYETEAITPWSAHPRYGQVFEKRSGVFHDHVCTSIAINLAFSAIEEMDLQIKSSKEKPRWKKKGGFSWNPEVLEDIESRLKAVGIDPARRIEWIDRGDETEFNIEPKRAQLTKYAASKVVRDRDFSFPDAIHACSYLRNYLTAHAFGAKTSLLGPYEVYNVQQVARCLILSKCCVWGKKTSDLSG